MNNSGHVVGFGTNPQGVTHALFTPVPEPDFYAMLLAG
ncbi:MAG: hypothetical protein EAZ11_07335 [Curvibacter sp.]|nr:MAG: hypothetical protein EAZ11_07335 [Curvibacter sp.]